MRMRAYADGHFEPHQRRSPGGIIFLIVPTSNSEKLRAMPAETKQKPSPCFPSPSRGLRKKPVRAAVWCMQFFARSTPRVNNASSSSDNEHRKKYFFLHCPALSYCIILRAAHHVLISIHREQNAQRENQTHTRQSGTL
jgi:hypothetical protein